MLAQAQCVPQITVESPTANSTVQGPTTISGYAYDNQSPYETGVSAVQVVLDGTLSSGQQLGTATEVARPDMVAALYRGYIYGFTLTADLSNVAPGAHTLTVYATTACGPLSTSSVPITVVSPVGAVSQVATPPSTPSYGYSCNPYYPTPQVGFPYNVPCASGPPASTACDPSFPTPLYGYTYVPCGGGGPSTGVCNPYYPTPEPAYPFNVPCGGGSSPTCGYGAPTYFDPYGGSSFCPTS